MSVVEIMNNNSVTEALWFCVVQPCFCSVPSLLSLLLFSSLRGRQLLNCLALRPPIGPNALPLIN